MPITLAPLVLLLLVALGVLVRGPLVAHAVAVEVEGGGSHSDRVAQHVDVHGARQA